MKQSRKKALLGYMFICPWLLGFLFFWLGPLGFSSYISFTRWTVYGQATFTGFSNYIKIFTDDPLFLQALKVTSLYVSGSIPLILMVSLLVAVLLNEKIKGLSFFRTVYYLPTVMTGISVALLWMWIFNPEFGIMNSLLEICFNLKGPKWLASTTWALPALIIMSLWGIGSPMLIFLAGLQGIPDRLYEAAEIDGATRWSKFRNITVPMISPIILFNLIMGIISAFQVFTQAYIMTAGGPHYATLFYVLYLYKNGFQWFKMGYAAALALILFVVILVAALIILRSSRGWVYYESKLGGV